MVPKSRLRRLHNRIGAMKRKEYRIECRLTRVITDFGFRLLLNENVYLRKGTDSLLLVGVENWGKSKKHVIRIQGKH